MQKIRILLPAFNEENTLPVLLRRIEEAKVNFNIHLDTLVVNDGSLDNTLDIVKSIAQQKNWIRILDLQPNRGLAGAMREGLKEAIVGMDDDDIIVTMDADDSHNPGLVFRMITQVREGSDIVIASRYCQGSRILGLSGYRKILSTVAGYLFKVFKPIKGVRDYTCGFRAYRVALLRRAHNHYKESFIQQQGFGCMAEILLKLRPFNPIIHEIPFVLRYDLKQGVSKMNVTRTITQTLKLIIQ